MHEVLTNDEYDEEFKGLMESLESFNWDIGESHGMYNAQLEMDGLNELTTSAQQKDDVKKKVKQAYLAAMMLSRANFIWCEGIKKELYNQYCLGTDNNPTIIKGVMSY